MQFDFWQRWGVGLDDSFANAWAALGLDYDASFLGARSVHNVNKTRWGGGWLSWAFPDSDGYIDGTPHEWAQAWIDVERSLKNPRRLRVHNAPPNEPILPWFRVLQQSDPAPGAVTLSVDAPRAELHIEWPLRLGCTSEDAWNVIERVEKLSPSFKLTRGVRLGRDTASCDILVHKGSARTLPRDLLVRPIGIKANIVVLQGGDEADWGEIDALLASVLVQTRASGYVLFPPTIDDQLLAEAVNGLVQELSHANPFDLALGETIRRCGLKDVIAGFTAEILDFDIRQLVERYNRRIAALPSGSVLDLSGVGSPDEWLSRGLQGGGLAGGERKSAARPDADREVAADTVSLELEVLQFDQESRAGSTIAEVSRAIEAASVPHAAWSARSARFLQQKSFVGHDGAFHEAKSGFIAGTPAMVRVRIAAPEESWDSLPNAFPVEELPRHLESWTLTVWLSELDHLPAPIRRRIELPRDGNSTECEFHFRPGTSERFEGRLTVLHRGRIIQTAMLRAAVLSTGEALQEGGAPRLEDLAAVRQRLGDLDKRRQFDLAFVANHDSKGRPLLTAVSDKAAWVNDLTQMPAISLDINTALSAVARSVRAYAKGLDGAKGKSLMIQLARYGGWLKLIIGGQLNYPTNNPVSDTHKYVQIVSTRVDSVVPLEFVYDYQPPEDGAEPCKHWREQLTKGECLASCDHTSSTTFCPLGFWGLKKVIERHAVTIGLAKDGHVLYLETETSRNRDTLYLGGAALLSGSSRVPDTEMTKLEGVMTARCGLAPQRAATFEKWEEMVIQYRPRLIVSLPHTGGTGSNVNLEIGGQPPKETITLKETHVFPPPVQGHQAPIVALLGCDTAGTANDYGHHVLALRGLGAGIVIGTIATVFGKHAAEVARELVEGMLPDAGTKPVRLGELMLAIRQKSLLKGHMMPLCVVAYGDADWKLSRETR